MEHSNWGEVNCLLNTFTRVWSAGGQASLSLNTLDGQVRAHLTLGLGPPSHPRPGAPEARGPPHSHPQHPHHPPSPQDQAPRRPRYRGPAARRRDMAQREAWWARRQEALATASSTSITSSPSHPLEPQEASTAEAQVPPSLPLSTSHTLDPKVTPIESEADISTFFQCDKCDFVSTSKHGVKVHYGTQHKESQKPEQFRAESLDNSLILTPIKEPREEDIEEANSPVAEVDKHPDSQKEQSDSEDEYEKFLQERSKKLDDLAKAKGTWCHECNDRCSTRSVLKRHMKNDHGMNIYPEIDMMLHGSW